MQYTSDVRCVRGWVCGAGSAAGSCAVGCISFCTGRVFPQDWVLKRDLGELSVEPSRLDEKSQYSIAFVRHVAISYHSPAVRDKFGKNFRIGSVSRQ